MKEKRITVRVPEDVYDVIVEKARREGMSLNAQIVKLLSVVAGVLDQKPRRGMRRPSQPGQGQLDEDAVHE